MVPTGNSYSEYLHYWNGVEYVYLALVTPVHSLSEGSQQRKMKLV